MNTHKSFTMFAHCLTSSGIDWCSGCVSPESGKGGGSILTSLEIIMNKFAVVSYLVVSNGNKSSFLHDKVCSTLSFCQQTQFSGSRCKCYPYLITKACLFNNTYPSSTSGNEESHIKEPGPLINLHFFSDCT